VAGKRSFRVDGNGFTLLHLDTAMEYADYSDEEKVGKIYLRDVAECLKILTKASRVQIFEHVARSFTPFCIFKLASVASKMPSLVSHCNWRNLCLQLTTVVYVGEFANSGPSESVLPLILKQT
jgi:hypothetical protein